MNAFSQSAALSLLWLGAASSVAHGQTAPLMDQAMFRATTISVAAEGEVRMAPDMATITLGVSSLAKTASQALADNAKRMDQVIEALKRSGVAVKDIQTSGLTVGAQYAYEQNQPPRLTGYQASHDITATLRSLSRVGDAVDAAVAAGATEVSGVSFGLSDAKAAEDSAREQAVIALRAKAELYAKATGYRISRLVFLSESGGSAPSRPMPMVRFAKSNITSAPTQVAPGELDVRIDVAGVYELTP